MINVTELRSVNFSMQAVLDVPLRFTPHAAGDTAGVLHCADYSSAKALQDAVMHKDIDSEIRGRCWCAGDDVFVI